MSKILEEIDHALANFDLSRGRPVAIELGELKYTQLVLDVAHLHRAGALQISPPARCRQMAPGK